MTRPARNPVDLDRLFEEAIARGDVEAIVALYEPDAVLRTQEGDAVGPDAMRQAIGGLIAMKASPKMDVVSIAAVGDVAVIFDDWSGTEQAVEGQPVEMAGRPSKLRASRGTATSPGTR